MSPRSWACQVAGSTRIFLPVHEGGSGQHDAWLEWNGPHGIRVNAVAPTGSIRISSRRSRAIPNSWLRWNVERLTPARRLAQLRKWRMPSCSWRARPIHGDGPCAGGGWRISGAIGWTLSTSARPADPSGSRWPCCCSLSANSPWPCPAGHRTSTTWRLLRLFGR